MKILKSPWLWLPIFCLVVFFRLEIALQLLNWRDGKGTESDSGVQHCLLWIYDDGRLATSCPSDIDIAKVFPAAKMSAFCEGSRILRIGNVYEQTEAGCLALIARSTTE